MKTVEAIIGQEEKVLNYFGLPGITGNRHVTCPLCKKHNKFRINRKENRVAYICVCGNGSVINLIMESKGYDYATACKEIDEIIGNRPLPTGVPRKTDKVSKKDMLLNRFSAIHTIKDTQVEAYLNSRGIYELPQMSVKFARAEWDAKEGRNFACMYAVATTENMDIAYTHKTYLENGKKAQVLANKKIYTVNDYNKPCQTCNTTHAASVAVRMFEHDSILGISEGIESALSAKQLFNVPTWSVLNTSIMKAFKAPAGVKTLVIYADNDNNGAGLAAAFVCGNKNILANNDVERVQIVTPEVKGKDFNDMLMAPIGVTEFELIK